MGSPMAVWNEYVGRYPQIQRNNTLIIRYEDLVMEPGKAVKQICMMVGAACNFNEAIMNTPAKYGGRGRRRAMDKIKNLSYLKVFTAEERQHVCDELDKRSCQ